MMREVSQVRYEINGELTEKEMCGYTELLTGLPLEISLKNTIKSGLENGLPIEYFIQLGVIAGDKNKLLAEYGG